MWRLTGLPAAAWLPELLHALLFGESKAACGSRLRLLLPLLLYTS